MMNSLFNPQIIKTGKTRYTTSIMVNDAWKDVNAVRIKSELEYDPDTKKFKLKLKEIYEQTV
jgi:hypothetical protein